LHQERTKDTPIAMDKITSIIKQSIPLSREEALQAQLNKQVFRFKPNPRRAYLVHYFCNNEEGVHNKNAYVVCVYHGAWYQVKPDQNTGEPVLGEPALAIHVYDCEDKTKSSQQSSDDEQRMDLVDDKIRRSLATISPIQVSVPTMLVMRTSPVIAVTMGRSGTPPLRQGTPPLVVGATLLSIQTKLNATLRWTGPPEGGSLDTPGGPGRGPQIPQQLVTPTGNIKTMGQLPQVFTGDHSKADNFIEEVKEYLCLNQDIAGFNLPIKKIAFMLTLIKGSDTTGWTCNLGDFLDMLGPAGNVLDLWAQFLLGFGQQFKDM
jgi:hypothetical protein